MINDGTFGHTKVNPWALLIAAGVLPDKKILERAARLDDSSVVICRDEWAVIAGIYDEAKDREIQTLNRIRISRQSEAARTAELRKAVQRAERAIAKLTKLNLSV